MPGLTALCPVTASWLVRFPLSNAIGGYTISFVALRAGDAEIWKNHPCSLDSTLNLCVIKTGLQQLMSDQAVLFPFPEM